MVSDRDYFLHIRVTELELENWREAAERVDRSLSGWVRERLNRIAEEEMRDV